MSEMFRKAILPEGPEIGAAYPWYRAAAIARQPSIATNAKADHRTQVPPKYKLAEVQTWKFEHKHKHKHKHKHGGSQKLGTARAPLGPHPGARNLLGFRPSHRAVTLGHHGASDPMDAPRAFFPLLCWPRRSDQ